MKRQNTTQQKPRLFQLVRHTDVSGVRGTGTLAEGVEWSDGAVTLRWRGRRSDPSVWDGGIEALLAAHGHNGRTLIHWLTTPQPTPTEQPTHQQPASQSTQRSTRQQPASQSTQRSTRQQPASQTAAARRGIQQYVEQQPSTPQTGAAQEGVVAVGLWLPAAGVDGLCRRCGRGWPCLGCDP